jgi:hypothetical protein
MHLLYYMDWYIRPVDRASVTGRGRVEDEGVNRGSQPRARSSNVREICLIENFSFFHLEVKCLSKFPGWGL